MTDLKLRRRREEDQTRVSEQLSIGRSGGDDYWSYRVDLTEKQAVIGFPKHGTIGIDFLHNTGSDLPYAVGVEYLADFMADGRLLGGDAEISRADVVQAITMIRDAVVADGVGDMTCMGLCKEIENHIRWGRRAPDDDPTEGLSPHWVEDCPLGPSPIAKFLARDGVRGENGWLIEEDEDDESDD